MASPQGMYYPGPSNGFGNGHDHGQGRNSPLNPYMVNNHPAGGYFPPPRSTAKIAIRAPKAGDSNGNGDSGSGAGAGTGSSDPQTNGAEGGGDSGASAGEYYAQHYNPYVQPFVPSHRQEAVYYAPHTMNGQQYGQWQGYPDQGYYDSNGSYGY
jgi:hypothetical protein